MRFIIRKFVEAKDLEDALRKSKRVKAFEIYLDNEVWKDRRYELKDTKQNRIGFKDKLTK